MRDGLLEETQEKIQEYAEEISMQGLRSDSPEKQKCCCHEGRKKRRSETEYKDLIHRLNRIEGQVRGIKRMVDEDAYCPDILIQVSAIQAALNSFNKLLLANHIRSCVADDIRKGNDEVIDELVGTMQKLMK